MLLKMSKVRIIGTKRRVEDTVRLLHRAGVLQIEDMSGMPEPPLPAMAVDEKRQEERQEITFLGARLEALLSILPRPALDEDELDRLYDQLYLEPSPELMKPIRQDLEEIGLQVQELAEQRETLENELVALPRYEDTIRRLVPLTTGMAELSGFETVVAVMMERRYNFVVDLIREELQDMTEGQFELVSRNVDERTTAALVGVPRRFSARVESLLTREHLTRVRLPEELTGISFSDALSRIEERQLSIPRELEQIEGSLGGLSEGCYGRLLTWRAICTDRVEEIDVLGNFGQTRRTFLVQGWIPQRDIPGLERLLEEELKGEAYLAEMEMGREELEHAPVAFRNLRIVQPFEALIRLLALPRYGTLDPTPLMAIFLPLFFGIILGDVAYGIVVGAGAFYLARRSRPGSTMHSLGRVLLICAFWAIVWGVIFGEFLGNLGEHYGMHPLWINRAEAMIPLIVFSIAIGVVHVLLGLVLGVWNAVRERSRREVLERGGMLVSLVALFLLAATMQKYLPAALTTPSAALLVIGLVVLMVSMGGVGIVLGPIEFLGAIGNMLSYIRIAAIGISSVYLAEVANEMAGAAGNIILGAIIAGFLHILNIALGVMSPTIQSLRLHYVEFFGKFYQSGGEEYAPFRREGIQ